jgi:hypothetical protein
MADLRPTRHITIRPALPLWQFAVCAIVVALIGFWLGLGHS